MEQLVVSDIAAVTDQARVTLTGVPDQPGLASALFDQVAQAGVFVDMIVQSCDGYLGETSIRFTVPQSQMPAALAAVESLGQRFQFRQVSSSREIAKLSVSGIGLRSHTQVAISMFEALTRAGINIQMINTSELRVNAVIDRQHAERGAEALEAVFASVPR